MYVANAQKVALDTLLSGRIVPADRQAPRPADTINAQRRHKRSHHCFFLRDACLTCASCSGVRFISTDRFISVRIDAACVSEGRGSRCVSSDKPSHALTHRARRRRAQAGLGCRCILGFLQHRQAGPLFLQGLAHDAGIDDAWGLSMALGRAQLGEGGQGQAGSKTPPAQESRRGQGQAAELGCTRHGEQRL